MKRIFLSVTFLLATTAQAQHPHGYTAERTREIKALSSEEISQYRSGAGMGFAMAAELNHFPGPMHALEHADQLKLTPSQRDALTALMHRHKTEAREIGTRLVDAERELDRLFASSNVTPEDLRSRVRAAGELRSEYRLSHLETHRSTRSLLTSGQIERYDQLRGYGGGDAQDQEKHAR